MIQKPVFSNLSFLTLLRFTLIAGVFVLSVTSPMAHAQQDELPEVLNKNMFDDAQLIKGYSEKYQNEPKEILLAMLKDQALNPYQKTAAIRVFRERFSQLVVSREKLMIEHDLIRLINQTNSPFIETEIMHTLCRLDRYKYFDAMAPALILKLDHYNLEVMEMAYSALNNIIDTGNNNKREARIVFNTLRKVFFLSRNTLKNVKTPDTRLSNKLNILRWSIKILGSHELKRLPKQLIHLL